MGEGDVNVHCIASYEDVGTLKTLLRSRCCYVEDAVTLKMLERWRCCYVDDVGTFKMLLRWRCCYSIQDVVTLKMLLRWRCCYVEDVVALKMLLGWRCCYIQFVVTLKMLLRWRCCYVQVVLGLKRKQTHVHFAHGSLVDYDMFMSITRNLKIQKTPNFFGKRNNIIYKLMNLKKTKQRWNSGQHIPDMLSACWANCWYSQVIGRTQNTVKHSENDIFQTGQQWTSIALRGTPSLYPLYSVFIYIYYRLYIYMIICYMSKEAWNHKQTEINAVFPTQPCVM